MYLLDPGEFKEDSAYKILGEAYEKLEMFDEALKTYKTLLEKGFDSDDLQARISKVENIIMNDDKLYISENEDKKTTKSIKFSESITYRDK